MADFRQSPESFDAESRLPSLNGNGRGESSITAGKQSFLDQPVHHWLGSFDQAARDGVEDRESFLAILRFSRGDGNAVFGRREGAAARLRLLKSWSDRIGDPSLSALVDRWLRRDGPATPLPFPSQARTPGPLVVMRSDWGPRAELMAIDHRRPGDETSLEVASSGLTWLGPSWTSVDSARRASPAVATVWSSSVYADHCEWDYRIGTTRVTRSISLLRGKSLALLGQHEEGPGDSIAMSLGLGEGVEARFVEGSRAVRLSAGRGRPTARLVPLGLPSHDRPTELGSIAIEEGRIEIRQQCAGMRRRWLAVLVGWGKPPESWRPLTVAERSKGCRGDVAVAARVAWGPRSDGLVVYRSLGKPALRSFLGHQTSARYLVGSFDRSGEVRPILKVGP